MILQALLFALFSIFSAVAFELPANSSQCLVGTADGWDSSTTTLRLYQKTDGVWKAVGTPWPGRLGKNGLVWGKGIHPQSAAVTTKKEGDNRSPAGVFAIGDAWGYAHSIHKLPALSYHTITPRDLWVEDPASPNYNQHLLLSHDPATPWEKKQQMKQSDPAHALKLFIAHNAPPHAIAAAGSSIFFHIWRSGGARATAGCTAMEQARLEWLISQIDPNCHPLYVLLPRTDYQKYRGAWKLP